MQKLLVIEDSTINAIISDPQLMALLPCLNGTKKDLGSLKAGGSNCKKCAAKKKQLRQSAYRTAKQCLKSLRGDRLTKVKQLLHAEQLRVVTQGTGGKRVKYTL